MQTMAFHKWSHGRPLRRNANNVKTNVLRSLTPFERAAAVFRFMSVSNDVVTCSVKPNDVKGIRHAFDIYTYTGLAVSKM